MVWGAGSGDVRIEDGILRSRGLGAALTPPLSLVRDDLGIYYDPSQPSRLEALIAAPLPPGGAERAETLVAALCKGGLTKYNIAGMRPDLPQGHRILVPGQVEDDASIRLGAARSEQRRPAGRRCAGKTPMRSSSTSPTRMSKRACAPVR